MRLIGLSAAAGALIALAACGSGEDAGDDAAMELELSAVSIRALDGFADLGGDVSAIALIPPTAGPTGGRAVVSVEGRGLVVLDLFDTRERVTTAPEAASIITGPEFRYRGAAAPLVIAAGGSQDGPTVYLYVASAEALQQVLTQPIAPDMQVERMCAVRHTPALLEFLTISGDRAQRWRLRDQGDDRLTAELIGEVDEAVAARACAIAPDGTFIVLDAEGRIGGDGPTRETNALVAVRLDLEEYALIARPQAGDIAAINRANMRLAARFRIDGALNAPASESPELIAVSTENFGGAAYRGGILAVVDGNAVSLVSLEQLLGALRPQAPARPERPAG